MRLLKYIIIKLWRGKKLTPLQKERKGQAIHELRSRGPRDSKGSLSFGGF